MILLVVVPKLKFSFIVPAFNEEKLLPETLRCIRESASVLTSKGVSWEIVVCDNNSTDQTSIIAQEHAARVVFEPKNQIARARNSGHPLQKVNGLFSLMQIRFLLRLYFKICWIRFRVRPFRAEVL